jgi:uncharacterized protein DUF3800
VLALAHQHDPERPFVILTAYLDEGGTHGGSPATVMAGVLGNVRQWERFQDQFDRIKRRHGFKILHMKKFLKRDGDFKGWSPERCVALVEDIVVSTEGTYSDGVVMVLNNADYERDYLQGERPRKLRLDSKYGLCFRHCLYHLMLQAQRRRFRKKIPKLHIVLESGHQNAGDAERIFHETKAEFKGGELDVLGAITFADKDECDPLMMADSLAHSHYRQSAGTWVKRPSRFKFLPHGTRKRGYTRLEYKPGGLARTKVQLVADAQQPRVRAPT